MIRFCLAIATLLVASVTAAVACPDPDAWGERHAFTGKELYSEKRLSVTAGGNVNLGECYDGTPGFGYVIETPDFSMRYERDGAFDLKMSTSGDCDTILLVKDTARDWFYNDDGGDGLGAAIWLQDPSSGYIDVWVGTASSGNCSATLYLETFEAGSAEDDDDWDDSDLFWFDLF